jgi:hypothetical protein
MKTRFSPLIVGALAALVIAQGALQRTTIYPQWSRDFSPGKDRLVGEGMSPDQMLFALAGFREMIAGILWVRADAFFDSGNYDAILPIIRLVTILDPKQLDVYATGMWHIGYNFTDEEQRSDRRYIPSALALGKEGARQNPETYELFFETGWIWYHKIEDDFPKAVAWFQEAHKRKDMIPARKNLLAMAFQRNGQIDEALDTYFRLFDEAVQTYGQDGAYGNRQNRDTIENNIDTTLVRMAQRGHFARAQGRGNEGYDVHPPFDVGFSVKATVVEPRVIEFEGTWNVLPVGTRIRVVLKDKDYPHGRPAAMDWDFSDDVNLDPPRERTFMQDQLFVRNQRFSRKVDMSRDPTMYPFTSDEYELEFYYNARNAPAHIQDKFGWNGEGMTDKNFLNTDIRTGQRVVYKRFVLTKDQILRRGEWQDVTPVVKTDNFREIRRTRGGADDVLLPIPSIRSQ